MTVKPQITIYHNPKCSKSRQTLALIEAAGQQPKIVLYLEQGLSGNEVKGLLKKLGWNAGQIIRSKEAKEEGLDIATMTEAQKIAAIAAHPRILERPIVVKGDRAVMGRPPETVAELL